MILECSKDCGFVASHAGALTVHERVCEGLGSRSSPSPKLVEVERGLLTGAEPEEIAREARRIVKRKRRQAPDPPTGRTASITGAAGELLVAADLMLKGYDVFRALAPNAGVDLIAVKDGEFVQVEVRNGTRHAPGAKLHCQLSGSWDVLAVVDRAAGLIEYRGSDGKTPCSL